MLANLNAKLVIRIVCHIGGRGLAILSDAEDPKKVLKGTLSDREKIEIL